MHISQDEDLCKVAGGAEETAVLSGCAAASAKKKKKNNIKISAIIKQQLFP